MEIIKHVLLCFYDWRVDSLISTPWNWFQPLAQVIQDHGRNQLGRYWWQRCKLPWKTLLFRSHSEAWLPSRTTELEADRCGWPCVATGTGKAAGWLLVGLRGPLSWLGRKFSVLKCVYRGCWEGQPEVCWRAHGDTIEQLALLSIEVLLW